MLEDIRGRLNSSTQLLLQLQNRAGNLEEAQALTAQQLKAQKHDRGEVLRRATLELAIAELTRGAGESNSASPASTPSHKHGLVIKSTISQIYALGRWSLPLSAIRNQPCWLVHTLKMVSLLLIS